MPSAPRRRIRRHGSVMWVIAIASASLICGEGGHATSASASFEFESAATAPDWRLPLADSSIERPFSAPAHDYGPGHRGVDLRANAPDARVDAPADGVIAFEGIVVDRGVITIDHGQGWVTTLEPVDASVAAGDVVSRGDAIGTLSTGGHAAPGRLHVGVRLNGVYVNPLALVGSIPRAVLLPCC